jgi:hypothetical protein
MSKDLTIGELVSSYLENEMTEIERLEFENQLLNNPELRTEYNLQKDLINGIKQSRMAELKARLDNITIHTPVYQTIGYKAFLATSLSVIVGISAYFLISEKDALMASQVDLSQNEIIIEEEAVLPEAPKAIVPAASDQTTGLTIAEPRELVQEEEAPIASAMPEKAEPINPNVIEPDVIEGFEEDEFTTEEINVEVQISELENVKEEVESTVEIASVENRRNKFHYRFFENKLYLIGNFNDMPYEIIELNAKSGKSYFLFYNDSFYRLESEQLKPAPLQKIENDSLVNELRVIQKNQSD